MRWKMAAMSPIAVVAGLGVGIGACEVRTEDDAAATFLGVSQLVAPAHGRPFFAVAAPLVVADGPVAVAAVDPEPKDPTGTGPAGSREGAETVRLVRGPGGDAAIVTAGDAGRDDVSSLWGRRTASSEPSCVDAGPIDPTTALAAIVFTFGALIAAFGLEPYRRAA
jgi:voltage-gated potassium channel Kch